MRFREATLDDAPAIADLLTAVEPDEPRDPVLWRHRWEAWASTGHPSRAYLMEREDSPAGLAEWWFQPPPEGGRRYGSLRVATLDPDPEMFSAGLARVEDELRQVPVEEFSIQVPDGEGFRQEMLAAAGYRRDRLQRCWELDLRARESGLREAAAAARRRVEAAGLSLTTIEDAAAHDGDILQKVFEVDRAATRDIPSTVPPWTPPWEAWLRIMSSPALHRDRMWLALEAGEVLGMSWLSFPPIRGNVYTDWTGVARAARGRGLARALKLQTLVQALDLGVGRVRTANDEANAPILHLNQELGYRAVPGTRLWLKNA